MTTDDTLRYKKLIEKVPLITKEEDDQLSEASLGKRTFKHYPLSVDLKLVVSLICSYIG